MAVRNLQKKQFILFPTESVGFLWLRGLRVSMFSEFVVFPVA